MAYLNQDSFSAFGSVYLLAVESARLIWYTKSISSSDHLEYVLILICVRNSQKGFGKCLQEIIFLSEVGKVSNSILKSNKTTKFLAVVFYFTSAVALLVGKAQILSFLPIPKTVDTPRGKWATESLLHSSSIWILRSFSLHWFSSSMIPLNFLIIFVS